MVRTTPTSPVDLAASLPEVLPFGRNAVRLHPRLGSPGASDSSMGGPLLWPADEPWPSCPYSDHQVYGEAPVGPEPVALVPVVQMYARDVPGLPFPDGTDVCQVLWCPLDHPAHGWSPRPQLFWRRAAYVADPLTTVPGPRRFQKNYLPRPHGWPPPFTASPWEEIAEFLGGIAQRHPEFGHMTAIASSVLALGAAGQLAGCTSMHDLIVVTIPIPEPPYDVIAVRAPGSLRHPLTGHVLIEHLSCTGHNERIERPAAEAVPVFWQFVTAKYGLHPRPPARPEQNRSS